MDAHARERPLDVGGRVAQAHRLRVGEREADGDVALERVVGRGLVGHDVGDDAAAREGPEEVDHVRAHADRDRLPGVAGGDGSVDRGVEVVDPAVEVLRGQALLDARRVDVSAEERRARHAGGERLGAAHAPEPPGDHEAVREVAVEVGAPAGGEGLVGALEDPLRPDVDPRAGRHLAEHREPDRLEAAELVPVRPVRDDLAVRDEHPGRVLVGAPDGDRTAGLDAEGLVLPHGRERAEDRADVVPGAGGPAGASVHDEVLGILRHLRVEVVLEHPVGALEPPRGAGLRGAPGGADGASVARGEVAGRRRRRRGGRHDGAW